MTDNHGKGCIKSPIDLRDFRFDRKASASGGYPESFALEKKVAVKSQGIISSCCPHATAEILEYYNDGKPKMSTNFIYGSKTNSGKGMYLREACKIVYKYGDMTYTDCPGNTEVDEVYDKVKEAKDDADKCNTAAKYKIKKYTKLTSNNDIKYALMTYGPVLAAIHWYDEYTIDDDGLVTFDKTTEKGGHAIMIYGWIQDKWLCQNSWGTKWGNNGYFRIDMSEDKPYEAYSLVDADNDDVVNPTYNSKLLACILNSASKFLNWIKR